MQYDDEYTINNKYCIAGVVPLSTLLVWGVLIVWGTIVFNAIV